MNHLIFIKKFFSTTIFIKVSKFIIAFIFTILFYSCFQQSATGNQDIITIPVNTKGSLTQGLLYLPENYKKSLVRYPLIINLNEEAQNGATVKDILSYGLPATIAKGIHPKIVSEGRIYEFVVFSPQVSKKLYRNNELGYILSYLIKKYTIDTAKIYVTGTGIYTSTITADSVFTKKIAAVVAVNPITLNFSQNKNAQNIIKQYPVPLLNIYSASDTKIISEAKFNASANAVNLAVKYKSIGVVNVKHAIEDIAFNPASTFGSFGINIYQWMLQHSKNSLDKPAETVTSNCKGKKIYIVKNSDNNVYIDGRSFSYNAGDTFVLKASQNPYAYFELAYFTRGTDSCPLVIINEGGRVKLTTGFSFTGCRHLKITGTGTGTADRYGFYISQDQGYGVGISAQGRSSNIEIEHLEIYNKNYGVWLKHEADCTDSLQFPNWILHDVSIHDNYIHHMLQEGMYLGSTDPNGIRTIECDGKPLSPKPMRLGNIHIYNNIIDSTWRGGIQLSGADSGYNEINNNTITNCGFEYNGEQGNGIIIGGYSHADINDNYVRTTFGAGIFSLGAGLVKIHDNMIDSSGFLGGKGKGSSNIMVDTRPTNFPSPGQPNPVLTKFYIWNNKLGANTDYNIRIYKTFNTYKSGNIIYNNNGNTSIAIGIKWTQNPTGLKK